VDPDLEHDLDINEAREQDEASFAHMDRPASQKQLKYIWGLMKTLNLEALWMDGLTSDQAKQVIEAYLSEKAARGL
jgi:hypothetical protein